MIKRAISPKLKGLSLKLPVVSVVGPRQSGKTTLVKTVFPRTDYVSMEDPDTREFALKDPRGFLGL
ncbi:MAG: AAA family ATPase [Planctomycetota bacterium]